MKKIIEEIRYGGNSRYFKVTTKDDKNRDISINYIKYIFKKVEIDNLSYFLLYDNEMNIIEKAYNFVNIKHQYKSGNTKLQLMVALKQFYEFSDIIGIPINEFDTDDFTKLQLFLQGSTKIDTFTNLYTYSTKEIHVVKKYMTIIEDFLKYSKYKNHNKIIKINIQSNKSINKNYNCPKYISMEEMKKVLQYLKADDTLDSETKLKYECIYRLMYETGLRIGEILGLTMQDIKLHKRKVDGLNIGILYIRNRISDKKDQYAKNRLHIYNIDGYKSNLYNTKNVGYQTAVISESLYDDIMKYFDDFCEKMLVKDLTPALADDVNNDNEYNYYIFNNKCKNTPLSKKVLENYTRNMFKEIKIPLDNNKRFINLFHRFRHGFAMNLLFIQGLSPNEAIKYTRHSSSRSLEPYINPTDEDIIKHLENIEILKEKLERNDN